MILTVTLHPALDKIIRLRRLRANDATRATIVMQYGGGKGNNVARALTRMGVPTLATGFQGGCIGQSLIHQFKEEGIVTDFVICKASTRTSLMIIEEETGQTYSIYEPGQLIEPAELVEFHNHFLDLLEKATFVLFCGSGQTPALAALYGELIQAVRSRGIQCALDSSGAALREGVKAKPYMVKVNGEELSNLIGSPLSDLSSQVKAIQELHQTGIELVCLTRGAEGLLLTNGKTCLEGKLVMENVVNVMGCGDSVLAGMVSAMLEGLDLENITRRGVACGAANTQTIGAGFIDVALVRQLETQVSVRQLTL